MKKSLKTIGIILVVLVLILFIVGLATRTFVSDFEYVVNKETKAVTITGVNAYKFHVIIPKTIDGYTVVAIDDYAFKDNNHITVVEIPNTIQYIGKGAFYNCSNLFAVYGLEDCFELRTIEDETFFKCEWLRRITLPKNLEAIGDCAFKACFRLQKLLIPKSISLIGEEAFSNCKSIKDIKIPQGVTRIENETFLSCLSMKSITLPEGITHIGQEAFSACSKLESIVIPATVETMGAGVFIRCSSLMSIDVAQNNPAYISIDGVLYDMDITELIAYPSGKTDKTYSIPQGVTKISKAVFAYNQHLDTLNVPKSLNLIENFFLYDASVKTINYDGSVADWKEIDTIGGLDFGELFGAINCSDGKISAYGEVTYN